MGRTARNQAEGKAPPTLEVPTQRVPGNTLVLEQISCWARNP